MRSKFIEQLGYLKFNPFQLPVYGLFRFKRYCNLFLVFFYPGTSYERGSCFSFSYSAPVSRFDSLQSFYDYVKLRFYAK